MERFDTVDAWTAYEHMTDLMGASKLLDELADALGTAELGENLEYIARMNWGGGDEYYERFEKMGWSDYEVFTEMRELFGDESLLHQIAKALGNDSLEDNLAWIARQYGYEESELGGEEVYEFDESEITDDMIADNFDYWGMKLDEGDTFDTIRSLCEEEFEVSQSTYVDDGEIDYDTLVSDVCHNHGVDLGENEYWEDNEVKNYDDDTVDEDVSLNDTEIENSLIVNDKPKTSKIRARHKKISEYLRDK